jgi:hypothetical protein
MTPQERQLVADLFERLAALENQPRDPEAEQLVREGLAKAPHAVYALVQSVLVQDEALKHADGYIRELEDALQGGDQQAAGQSQGGQPKGFLDNMRDALFGREEPRGSVPSVGRGGEPMGVPPQYRGAGASGPGGGASPWGNTAAPQPQWGGGGQQWGGAQPMPQEPPHGGSFLGTAAAAAAGMVGGGLLLNGIRGMLGGAQHRGPFAGAFGELSGGGSRPGGSESGGALAREAGLDDIGRGGNRTGPSGGDDNTGDYRTAGLVGDSDSDSGDDVDGDADSDDDAGGDGDDTNYA